MESVDRQDGSAQYKGVGLEYLSTRVHDNGLVLVHSIVQHNLLALDALQLCKELGQLLALQRALGCTAFLTVRLEAQAQAERLVCVSVAAGA